MTTPFSGEEKFKELCEFIRLVPEYISSRFLEYLFGFCRSEHRNATSFGAYAGVTHVSHHHWVIKLEAVLGEGMPGSKRGVSKGKARIDWERGE